MICTCASCLFISTKIPVRVSATSSVVWFSVLRKIRNKEQLCEVLFYFYPEFSICSVEWWAFPKFNNFRNFRRLSTEVFFPAVSSSGIYSDTLGNFQFLHNLNVIRNLSFELHIDKALFNCTLRGRHPMKIQSSVSFI